MVARYYLEIASDTDGGHQRILAVCLQELEGFTSKRRAQVLTRWEWGERELVRALVDRGALEPSDRFQAIGPHIAEDLALLLDRAGTLRQGNPNRAQLERVWSTRAAKSPEDRGGTPLPPNRCLEFYRNGQYERVAEELIRRAEATLASLGGT